MKTSVALLALTFSLGAVVRADEIEFTTLPQPIQTTVIRETHIPSAIAVTRVVRQDGGIYAVTVRQAEGARVRLCKRKRHDRPDTELDGYYYDDGTDRGTDCHL
jgi:hypothetical protein